MAKKLSAAVIRTDNSIDLLHYEVTLQWLQDMVGGYIEAVDVDPDGTVMYCNEEGKLINLPVNVIATELFRASHGFYDVIMGNVVLIGSDGSTGENADLTPHGFELLTAAVDRARAAQS